MLAWVCLLLAFLCQGGKKPFTRNCRNSDSMFSAEAHTEKGLYDIIRIFIVK